MTVETTTRETDAYDCGLPSLALRIDAACDRYESDWRRRSRPKIEQFLAAAPEPERPALLLELLAVELDLRRGCGECPAFHEYLERFPNYEDQVAEIFDAPSLRASPTTTRTNRVGSIPGKLPSIPGFEISGVLGRGGMAVVYRARQIRLDRPCALKMILGGPHSDPLSITRFLGEARTIARLRHPNVLQIHSVGEVHEGPFLELEYADGGSLADRLDGTPWKPREAAALIEVLARAVGDIHRLGVVHRDLKPANVLLTADGTPKVADFGLAKIVGGGSSLTLSESVMGTPYYMSPEQAEGRIKDVGPGADVYALGVILYELLTGRRPFRAASVLETLEQVKYADPVPPSRLVPRIHRDIETICSKCLNKDVARRYDSALALADDLKRWQAGLSIRARRPGLVEQAWRLIRRNSAFATLAAMVTLVTVAGISAAVFWWNQVSVSAATARAKVEMLTKAETTAVPEIVEQLAPLRRWADPLLAQAVRNCPAGSRAALHINLAMLRADPSRKTILFGWLTKAETRPEELLLIREQLTRQGHAETIVVQLWAELEGASRLNDGQLRAAGALAGFDPKNPRWKDVARQVAAKLVLENPLLLGHWSEVFRPVGGSLSGPLLRSYFDRGKPEARMVAEGFLLDFAARPENPTQPEDYADIITDADAPRFEQILEILESHADRRRAIDRLSSKLDASTNGNNAQARQQGRAATALVRLGHADRVWRVLRTSANPGACTQFIHDLAAFGVDPHRLVARLAVESDVSARRALVLALGEYPVNRIPDGDRIALTDKLLHDFRHESDAGLHSAIDWLLRQIWGNAAELDRFVNELAGREAAEGRDWYVNG
jgi:hypothetical protein